MGAVVNLQCSPALLAPLFPCQFAKAMAASKDPVAHAGAGAVGKQLAVQPAGPLLILEVAAQADLVGQFEVRAAAIGDVSKAAVRVVVLKVHLADADQHLGIGSCPHEFEAVQRNAGARKVVVLIDALELVKAKPAAFGLKLNPVRELHVHEGANAVKAIGAGLRHSKSGVVGLKYRAQAAYGYCELASSGRGDNLCAGGCNSNGEQGQEQTKGRSFHHQRTRGHKSRPVQVNLSCRLKLNLTHSKSPWLGSVVLTPQSTLGICST